MVRRFCYAFIAQIREGEDIIIRTEAAKVLEEKKYMSTVQENIYSMGMIWLMKTKFSKHFDL